MITFFGNYLHLQHQITDHLGCLVLGSRVEMIGVVGIHISSGVKGHKWWKEEHAELISALLQSSTRLSNGGKYRMIGKRVLFSNLLLSKEGSKS